MSGNIVEKAFICEERRTPEGFCSRQTQQLNRLFGGEIIKYNNLSDVDPHKCPFSFNENVTVDKARENRILVKEIFKSISVLDLKEDNSGRINIVFGNKDFICKTIGMRKDIGVEEINILFDSGDDTVDSLKNMGYKVNVGFLMTRVNQYYYRTGQIGIAQYNSANRFLTLLVSPGEETIGLA
jgi:hypothetical protein